MKTPITASLYPLLFVAALCAQEPRIGDEITEKKSALATLEADHARLRSEGEARTKILAMSARYKHSNLDVWDCGLQK